MAYLCGPWPIPAACTYGLDVAQDLDVYAVAVASELLWSLSGRQFGTCTVTVRPCRTGCATGSLYGAAQAAALTHGPWFDVRAMPIMCGCPGECGCGPICEVTVPGPVVSVTEVTVDGVALVPGVDYLVYAGGRIVRSGGACWPSCQDMAVPLGEPGTWGITYVYGIPVPLAGQRAVAALAARIKRSCQSGAVYTCNTSSDYLESLTSEGQTLNFTDANELLSDGRTGIPDVDQWLAAVNPTAARAPVLVWSPDLPTYRRQVT